MAWIESHQALRNHPKVARLARVSNWSVPETIGRLQIFWWWCLDYATDGRLEQFDHETIAGVFGVTIDAQQFIHTLIEVKFLDSEPEIRVHDWWDYAGRFLQVRYKRTPKIWKEIKRYYGHSIQRTNNRTTTEQSAINNHKPNQPNLTNLNQSNLNQPTVVDAVQVLKKPSPPLNDVDWILSLKSNLTYHGLDVDRELGKCMAWCETNRKPFSRRRFVNWINRAERPMQAHGDSPFQRGMKDFLARHEGGDV